MNVNHLLNHIWYIEEKVWFHSNWIAKLSIRLRINHFCQIWWSYMTPRWRWWWWWWEWTKYGNIDYNNVKWLKHTQIWLTRTWTEIKGVERGERGEATGANTRNTSRRHVACCCCRRLVWVHLGATHHAISIIPFTLNSCFHPNSGCVLHYSICTSHLTSLLSFSLLIHYRPLVHLQTQHTFTLSLSLSLSLSDSLAISHLIHPLSFLGNWIQLFIFPIRYIPSIHCLRQHIYIHFY